MGRKRLNHTLGLFLALCLGVSACGPVSNGKKKSSLKVVTGCAVTQDQLNSFEGRWLPLWDFKGGTSALALMLDPKVPDHLDAAVAGAVATWNSHYGMQRVVALSVRKGPLPDFFSLTSKSIVNSSRNQFSVDSSGEKLPVGVFFMDQTDWDARFPNQSEVLAFTQAPIDAVSGNSINMTFRNARVAINARWFVGSGGFDLQSVLAHELGHLLGLRHSCESGSKNLPACESAPDEYQDALMFPAFGAGEIRGQLNSNDQGRANCLYGPNAGG